MFKIYYEHAAGKRNPWRTEIKPNDVKGKRISGQTNIHLINCMTLIVHHYSLVIFKIFFKLQ